MARYAVFMVIGSLVGACARSSADRPAADTTTAVVAAPATPRDSMPSQDSVLATLSHYFAKQISAESAAKVIVEYANGGGQLNFETDAELRSAIAREMKKRPQL